MSPDQWLASQQEEKPKGAKIGLMIITITAYYVLFNMDGKRFAVILKV